MKKELLFRTVLMKMETIIMRIKLKLIIIIILLSGKKSNCAKITQGCDLLVSKLMLPNLKTF